MSFKSDFGASELDLPKVADLKRFLGRNGFELIGDWGSYLERFQLKSHRGSFDVLIPVSNELSDFHLRMREALEELSWALETDAEQLVRKISYAERQLFRVRARPGDGSSSLPYDEGMGIVQNGWKLIKASAVSALAERRKKVIRGRPSNRVDRYMGEVRLGQTEVGSFIFNFVLPDTQGLFDPEISSDVESNDDVVSALVNGISLAHEMNGTRRVPSATRMEAVRLSANFCEALYEIVDWSGEVELQLTTLKAGKAIVGDGFLFDKRALPVLEKTATRLAPEENPEPKTLSGTITKLSEPAKRRRGSLDILTKIGKRRRSVRVLFGPHDRDTVIRAFKEKDSRLLTVSGFLRTGRNGHLSLDEAHGFDATKRGSLL